MVSITRIVCPVDFSACSQRALEYAVGIGRWYGASVTALHVFADMPVIDAVPMYRGQPLVLRHQDPIALRNGLDAFARRASPTSPVETEIADAFDVQKTILARAEALGADLIVMGTHGRSGIQHLVLGSVAEKVVRDARCPVLTVRAGAASDESPVSVPFREIVCAVDFATTSRRAFSLAFELAEEADAHLTLLHALEVPPELQVPMTIDEVDVAAARAGAEAAALQRLRELVPTEARTYCKVHTDVREARADRAIVDTARERHADLIVMGIHAHSAADRLIFGSNTQSVVRAALCPVLAIPAMMAAPQVGVA